MRVLIVGKAAPDRGGIPTFIEILRHSDLAGRHQLRILNLARDGTRQGGRLTPRNVSRTVSDAVAVFRAARGAQIMHLHTASTPTVTVVRAFLLSVAARTAGCKVLVHVHGGAVDSWLQGRPKRLLMRIAMHPAARVVAVWGAGYRLLSDVLGPARVVFVQNGVDVEAFRLVTA